MIISCYRDGWVGVAPWSRSGSAASRVPIEGTTQPSPMCLHMVRVPDRMHRLVPAARIWQLDPYLMQRHHVMDTA